MADFPLRPAPGARLPFANLTASAVGTSPQTATLQLPNYGIFLATLECWIGNLNNVGVLTAVVSWFSAGSGTVHKTDTISPATLTRDGGSPIISALTLSDPTTGGALSAQATWTGGSTQGANMGLRLFNLRDLSSFNY